MNKIKVAIPLKKNSGWLGGYNFQWAWSSGWAAGQVV